MLPKKVVPVSVLLCRKVGLRAAVHALEYVVSYGLLCESLGRETSSMRVYADFWKMSLAKAYREHDAFVLAFGPAADVAEIWKQMSGAVDERKDREVAVVQSMAVALKAA